MAQVGTTQAGVVAEPAVSPAGVDVEPTTGAELDGESSAGADEVGW
jgi:hypothetical protein